MCIGITFLFYRRKQYKKKALAVTDGVISWFNSAERAEKALATMLSWKARGIVRVTTGWCFADSQHVFVVNTNPFWITAMYISFTSYNLINLAVKSRHSFPARWVWLARFHVTLLPSWYDAKLKIFNILGVMANFSKYKFWPIYLASEMFYSLSVLAATS